MEQQQNNLMKELLREFRELKDQLTLKNNPLFAEWIPRSFVKSFFGYGDTQLATLERMEGIVVAKVGKRKFYFRKSIERFLEKNVR